MFGPLAFSNELRSLRDDTVELQSVAAAFVWLAGPRERWPRSLSVFCPSDTARFSGLTAAAAAAVAAATRSAEWLVFLTHKMAALTGRSRGTAIDGD